MLAYHVPMLNGEHLWPVFYIEIWIFKNQTIRQYSVSVVIHT